MMNQTSRQNAEPLLPTVYDTEEDQIRRASRGNQEAFGLLVERYRGLVFRTIFDLVRDEHSTEDLAQETFLRAHRFLNTLAEARAFKHWLCVIARNTALRALERKNAIAMELPGEKLEELSCASSAAGLDEAVEERLGSSEARGWLRSLPEHYRDTLTLRYVQDLSYQEISDALGVKLGTVKFRISHGVDLLKEMALAA